MGATASTLDGEQKAILSRRLQDAYEQLMSDGLEEDIIKDSMQSEYNKLVKSFVKEEKPDIKVNRSATKMAVSASAKDIGLSNLSSKFTRQGSVKDAKPSKFARRRSFDSNKSGASQKTQAVIQAAALVALSAASEDIKDSWDSVSHQPFCTTCQMAFKSADFLDRHQKYSDLHLKNVEKKAKKDAMMLEVFQKVPSVEEEPASVTVAASASSKLTETRQVEGKHYKLLYTGSKFFWRTQKNIDVDVYLHVLPHVVEIITFDPIKHREASRIYLNYYIIQETLEQLVSADLQAKLHELSQDRFHSLEDDSALRDQLLTQRVTTYILQRLQLDSTGHLGGEMKFVGQYGDSEGTSPLLAAAPPVLVPVSLTRRRRTSAEEIEATMNSISFDRTAIGESINLAMAYSSGGNSTHSTKGRINPQLNTTTTTMVATSLQAAGRISSAVHSAVQYMTSKRWYHGLSVPKQRFVRAVRRVIRQSLVGRTRSFLAAREKHLQLLPVLPNSPEMTASSKSSRKYSTARSRPREV